MTFRFRPNRSGIAQVAQSEELEDQMRASADAASDEARRIAPVATGAYRDSIVVEVGIEDGKATAHVVAQVPYAGFVEFGTSDTPTFAPLRRGAEAAGLRLR